MALFPTKGRYRAHPGFAAPFRQGWLLLLLLFPLLVHGQCQIQVYVDTTPVNQIEICLDDSLPLTARGECVLLWEDFNNMAPGSPAWSFVPTGIRYDNPCMNSANGSSYAWFGDLSPPAREIVSIDFDVLAGGYISFDLRYGLQAAGTPCDGPDAMREGMSLQYSTDFGDTWTDIAYFAPTGNVLPANPFTTLPSTFGPTAFTDWDQYVFQIPPAARTSHTRFRWIQLYANYYNGHFDDSWGLDNIKIARSIELETRWEHGPDSVYAGFVTPSTDSAFIVHLLDYQNTYDTIASDTILIIVHPIPAFEFIADTDQICFGDSLLISLSGNFKYVWSNGIHGDSPMVSPPDEATYVVTSTDNIGCFHIDSLTVFVQPLPVIHIEGDTICSGDTATLNAGGGISYEWTGNLNGASINVHPQSSTIYHLTVTGSNYCTDTASALVMVHPLPVIDAMGDTAICYGGYALLRVTGGQSFLWSDGKTLPLVEVAPEEDTWYSVTVTDIHQCNNIDSVMVRVNPMKQIQAWALEDTICRGTSALLSVEGGAWYEWSHGDILEQTEVWPGYDADYTVTAYNPYYGSLCSLDTTLQITVEECNTFYLANAFVPDGYTPEFKPAGNFFSIKDYQLLIFDRWGKMVFESRDWNEGWNGRINGDPAPAGVYAYKVKFTKAFSEENFEKIGSLTLIR